MKQQDPIRDSLSRTTAFFQPIVDLNTGQMLGAETLARVRQADGTFRSPADIIDAIEENLDHLELLMIALFRTIADKIVPLFERHRDFYISVNVPPTIIGSGRLRSILDSFKLSNHAHRLVCEITERQALTDAGRAALTHARDMGIRIAMDDFGTGHSGLKQLIGLQLDILKLDKSQIDPLMKDPTADRVLRGVVALAGALRLKVIAEGVEKPEQAFFLRAAGVDGGQGWLWSKAVPPEELEQLIVGRFEQYGFLK